MFNVVLSLRVRPLCAKGSAKTQLKTRRPTDEITSFRSPIDWPTLGAERKVRIFRSDVFPAVELMAVYVPRGWKTKRDRHGRGTIKSANKLNDSGPIVGVISASPRTVSSSDNSPGLGHSVGTR